MSLKASRRRKKVLKQRVFSYIFEMKKGEEEKVALRIVEDIELLMIEKNTIIHELFSCGWIDASIGDSLSNIDYTCIEPSVIFENIDCKKED